MHPGFRPEIPFPTALLRLQLHFLDTSQFTDEQRERWISIWNSANANYFREAKIEPFTLPEKKEPAAEKVLALAEQPLLLLMLALFDSEDNQLRKSKSLDRTKLYDSLLRRFVKRERGKERKFEHAEKFEQEDQIKIEMKRLGVAALGMYNRRKVHILAPELNEDLRFFSVERPVTVTSGRALSQADLLLGSFFFVHKSKAQQSAGAPEYHQEISAFEFLHNTFGEFLTADFVLRRALAEVEQLKALQESDVLRAQLEQRLGDADGFQREWFASLVYTPLFTRPVVLEMMREWIGHILKERNLARHVFVSHLETVILNQLKRLLSKREMPSIIRKETAQEGYRAPFGDHPLLGHVAIYSINLILLRVIVGGEPFVFDEGQIGKHEDGARPWDRLTHIWRSWFGLDNLNGVTAVLLADRQDAKITIRAKEKFQVAAAESQNRLETYMNVAVSLGDSISSGLTGLVLFDPSKPNLSDLNDAAERLSSEKVDLEFQIEMKRLLWNERHLEAGPGDEFWHSARRAWEMALRLDRIDELELITLAVRRTVRRISPRSIWQSLPPGATLDGFRKAFHPRETCELAARNPSAALLLYQMAKEIGDTEWRSEFRHGYREFGLRRHHPIELLERNPEAALAWVQLARELGGDGFIGHFESDFFERAFHPRHLLDLSERNPQAALAWIQVARELGGQRFLRHFDAEFMQHAFHPRQFLELSERNPEVALAWIRLAREVGGRGFLRHLDSESFERMFHPRQLMEQIERSPEIALVWVELARELGEEKLLTHLGPEYLERLLDPRHLLELSERSPEIALAWIELAQEWGGERFPRQFLSELFERAFHSRRLMEFLLELVERNPEAAIAWVRAAHELGAKGFFRHIDLGLFERAFHPRYLLELSDRNPEAALAWVQLVRELGGRGRFKRFDPEFVDRASHPRHLMDTLLELGERNPEAALAWLELAQEVGGESFLKGFDPEFFERAFSSFSIDRLLRRKPAGFAVLLRLVRILRSRPAADSLAQCLIAGLHGAGAGSWPVGNLPMSALRDMEWLATFANGPDLGPVLESLVGRDSRREEDHGSDKELS